jgi:hypothetical protein
MKAALTLFAALLVGSSACWAADFKGTQLSDDEGATLVILRSHGKALKAP